MNCHRHGFNQRLKKAAVPLVHYLLFRNDAGKRQKKPNRAKAESLVFLFLQQEGFC
jgi:hypothetical protein